MYETRQRTQTAYNHKKIYVNNKWTDRRKETLIQIFIVGKKRVSTKSYYAVTKLMARLVISLMMFKANFPEPCKRIGSRWFSEDFLFIRH